MAYLHIYKAAAGAGKTHVLVGAYLKLALQAPLDFNKILAITFTNRATEAMKHRILASIHAMAQGEPTPFSKEICQAFNWDMPTLSTRASLVQSQLLHQYDSLGVSTIDSFLQAILRNFAREMGLPYNFKIELDQEKMLAAAVDEVIEASTQDKQLYQFLIDFAEYNIRNGRNWHFKKSLKQLGYELFSEQFVEHQPTVLMALAIPDRLPSFLKEIQQTITHFEETLQQQGIQALETIQEARLTVADFSYGERGVAGYLANLAARKSYKPTQRSLEACQAIPAWYSKKSPSKDTIERIVTTHLQSLLQASVSYYELHYRTYYTALSIQATAHAFGILTYLVQALAKIRRKKNVLFMSDITYLLHQLIRNTETPFIYEKVGSHYHHFLIDEFQDISTLQWKNLKPLLEDGIANGYMSLVVGDVKQAIYRWRDSDWQLLASQVEKDFVDTAMTNLSYNWRSRPAIIQFNNTFFTQAYQWLIHDLAADIAAIEPITIREELNELLETVHKVYKNAYQTIPPDQPSCSEPGYVTVSFIDTTNRSTNYGSWKETIQPYLTTVLKDLANKGFKPHEIAFLARNRQEVAAIWQYLLSQQDSEKGYAPYTGLLGDTLYLGQTSWVNIIMGALTYLLYPGLITNTAELVYLYQEHIQGSALLTKHDLFQRCLHNQYHDLLPASFLDHIAYYAHCPLYECVQQLITCFQLHTPPATPFVAAFQDCLITYLADHPNDIAAFLSWWQTAGNEQTLPHKPTNQGWNVLTIHQAKGLEFKAVIVPFCDWAFDHPARKGPLIWCRTATMPFSTFPILPVLYSKQLADTHYRQAYYAEKIQVYLDHFNLLYVAFTRAVEALYIFAPQPRASGNFTTADLLYQTLTQGSSHGPAAKQQPDTAGLFIDWEDHWDATNQQLQVGKPLMDTRPGATKTHP